MVSRATEHYKSNFIRQHIMRQIFKRSYKAREILGVKHDAFLFFDDMIRIKNGRINQNINRFGKGSLYGKNEILGIAWTAVNGNQLKEVFLKIKNREFHAFKEIDGNSCKIRIKNGNTK